jgi:hypothetical protein
MGEFRVESRRTDAISVSERSGAGPPKELERLEKEEIVGLRYEQVPIEVDPLRVRAALVDG